jgi:lipid II:glycine glycyltransferase (peptidoglycan interpeptide bridge formation enzyme)
MVDFKVKIEKEGAIKQWDDFVDFSTTGSLFHKTAWLEAAAEETKTELIRILGFWGENIFIALPIFVKRSMGFKVAFSPPPKCLIPAMGLVISNDNVKQDGFEKKYFRAVDSIEKFIKSRLKVDYIRIVNSVELNDIRPFRWNNYRADPNYTYFINLNGDEKKKFENMKGQVRQHIRRAQKYSDLQIVSGDRRDYSDLIKLVRDRYSDQNLSLPVSDIYMKKIFDEYYNTNLFMIKAVQNNKHLLTGIVLLKYKNKIQFWIGGIPPKEKFVGINEFLHWNVIKENLNTNFKYYDLVGANTEHLCRYKSKFNPALRLYFTVEKGNLKGNLLKLFYSKFFIKNSSGRSL